MQMSKRSKCSQLRPTMSIPAAHEAAFVNACSTNGTFVRFPDGDDEEELVPMRATVVPVGAEIIFGANQA